MKHVAWALVTGALSLGLAADEVVLKNGKSIQFRALKDCSDILEIQTVDNQTVPILKSDVKEIRLAIPKAPITGATFVGDGTGASDKPVNLLALIDPKKHAVTGEWRFSNGGLSGGNGSLDVPYIPPGSAYDVEIVLERRDGDDEVNLGLVVDGKPFAFVLDWGKGAANGLSVISGKAVFENESKIAGRQLVARKPRQILCAVRPDKIVILMDGKEFLRWEGDVKRLSHAGRVKEQNLWLWAHQSTILVTKYTLTPRK